MQITDKKPSFNARLRTFDVLEITSLRLFQGNGMSGVKSVITTLHPQPPKATGCVGFKHFAKTLSEKINQKYPIIGEFSQKISKAETSELPKILEDAVKKLGKEIDVEV